MQKPVRQITDSQGLATAMMLGLMFLATSLIFVSVTASNLLFLSQKLSFAASQGAVLAADSFRGVSHGFPCEATASLASQLDLNLVSCRIVKGVSEVEMTKNHGLFLLSYKAFAK